MNHDAKGTIKRAERFQVILIGEGILVGAIAGFVVLFYRIVLVYAGQWTQKILTFTKGNLLRMAGWLIVLALLACVVARLLKYESMISGSGIPQLEGEMAGKLDQVWWKVLPSKFLGGFLCMLGGLALGREGPSIQLGAMVGKGISRGLDRGKTEEKFLLTCGASAGLAAAFHAPLAGVMFSLEEVHKNFSVSVLVSVMSASLTADFLSSTILGMDSVFQFDILKALPMEYYWMILLLGVVLGITGAFYNWFTLKAQECYQKATFLNPTMKIVVPLGSGHALIEELTHTEMMLGMILLLLLGRFLFSAISFGSGAPGGIFFPLLVIGGFIGGAFAAVGVQFFGLDSMYINNFVLLAMAGYFSAIVRAPLTGIILIFEMTGSLSQMLSLAIVSIVAYVVATLLRSKPIYESLLDRLLEKQGVQVSEGHGQKILTNYVIHQGSRVEETRICDTEWPDNCLLVAIQRGAEELIPRGQTRLLAGDVLVTMTDERDMPIIHEKMQQLCSEIF